MPVPIRPAARRALVRYRHRGLTPADALLVSYPKSGSTWLRFLLAHLLTGREADYATIRASVPPLGHHRGTPATLTDGGRLVRSHEPLTGRRPPGQPVLYLVRDPRDVCLSYFNHRRRQGYDEDLPAFVGGFLAGRVDGYGPWPRHVDAALTLEASRPGRFLRVRYEDLRADPVPMLGGVARFLGVDDDVERIEVALAANTRERMRAKEDDTFLRRVGMDGESLTPERRRWDELVSADLDRRFSAACEPLLTRCGYPASGVPWRGRTP